MERVKLTTKKELEIYMNPVRQQLLRELELSKVPMTPKMLADKLNISASGTQHHIKKLLLLGVIELDHTELINGITASFYKPTYVVVQIGMELNDNSIYLREALMQEKIFQIFKGFVAKKERLLKNDTWKDMDADTELTKLQKWGDTLTGVLHLTDEESAELMKIIMEYIQSHSKPSKERTPYEYALILYNAKEELDD
jgi:predicted transcriptional regulator